MHPNRHANGRQQAALGACILTAAGGVMDAWVYLAHGHLFANAQTGNIVLLAIHLTEGELDAAARTLPSILAFMAGLLVSRVLGVWLKAGGYNSRTIRLGGECTLLLALALVVHRLPDSIVTACVGFIAAVQITSLSHIGPASFNTGMTTGNLRAAVSAGVLAWFEPQSGSDKQKAVVLGLLCVAFLGGAILGGLSTRHLGDGTVYLIAGLVACAILTMWRAPDPLVDP